MDKTEMSNSSLLDPTTTFSPFHRNIPPVELSRGVLLGIAIYLTMIGKFHKKRQFFH